MWGQTDNLPRRERNLCFQGLCCILKSTKSYRVNGQEAAVAAAPKEVSFCVTARAGRKVGAGGTGDLRLWGDAGIFSFALQCFKHTEGLHQVAATLCDKAISILEYWNSGKGDMSVPV